MSVNINMGICFNSFPPGYSACFSRNQHDGTLGSLCDCISELVLDVTELFVSIQCILYICYSSNTFHDTSQS